MQEACAEWVAALYYVASRDPAVVVLTQSGTRQSFGKGALDPEPPAYVARLLAPYRRYTVATNQG